MSHAVHWSFEPSLQQSLLPHIRYKEQQAPVSVDTPPQIANLKVSVQPFQKDGEKAWVREERKHKTGLGATSSAVGTASCSPGNYLAASAWLQCRSHLHYGPVLQDLSSVKWPRRPQRGSTELLGQCPCWPWLCGAAPAPTAQLGGTVGICRVLLSSAAAMGPPVYRARWFYSHVLVKISGEDREEMDTAFCQPAFQEAQV